MKVRKREKKRHMKAYYDHDTMDKENSQTENIGRR